MINMINMNSYYIASKKENMNNMINMNSYYIASNKISFLYKNMII